MKRWNVVFVLALLLGACSTQAPRPSADNKATPQSGTYLADDGPGTDVPANLDSIPDAVPRAEPLHPYANRPYSALGKTYIPLQTVGNYKERGIASWYGRKFHGQRTSIGEVFDMYAMTAAHPTLPLPSYARVTNLANGKSVVVRLNHRGPFLRGRIIDLSYAAAYKLGFVNQGSAEVEVESLAPDRSEPLASAVEPVKVESVAVTRKMPTDQAGAVYLQLGAFKEQLGAESFLAKMRTELSDLGKDIILVYKRGLNRIHLGPYQNADAARRAANELAARLGFKPFVSQH